MAVSTLPEPSSTPVIRVASGETPCLQRMHHALHQPMNSSTTSMPSVNRHCNCLTEGLQPTGAPERPAEQRQTDRHAQHCQPMTGRKPNTAPGCTLRVAARLGTDKAVDDGEVVCLGAMTQP